MDPTLKLHADVDVMEHSPLLRGMVLTLRYADEHGGIGRCSDSDMALAVVPVMTNPYSLRSTVHFVQTLRE